MIGTRSLSSIKTRLQEAAIEEGIDSIKALERELRNIDDRAKTGKRMRLDPMLRESLDQLLKDLPKKRKVAKKKKTARLATRSSP